MNADFHYYGTGTAATKAGVMIDDAKTIANAAEFVDYVTAEKCLCIWQIVADDSAASKVLFEFNDPQMSCQDFYALFDYRHDIWLSFHFPPGNKEPHLRPDFDDAMKKWALQYMANFKPRECKNSDKLNKLRLCRPYSQFIIDMIWDTVNTIKQLKGETWKDAILGKISPSKRYIGDAFSRMEFALIFLGARMHVLADTWAHQDFTGYDDKYINYVDGDVFANYKSRDKMEKFEYRLVIPDADCTFFPKSGRGHANMGHVPDYGWLKFEYPAPWRKTPALQSRDNFKEYKEAWLEIARVIKFVLGKADDINMPKEIEEMLFTLFHVDCSKVSAPIECEKAWAAGPGHYVADGFHWKDNLNNPAIGIMHGWPSIRTERAQIKEGSVLHMFELALLMHYRWCQHWARLNPEYKWDPTILAAEDFKSDESAADGR